MMKKILSIFLVFLLSFTMIHLNTVNATEATTLKIHYYRFDGDYDKWNVWLWGYPDGDGNAYDFNGEDSYGKLLTLDLTDNGLDAFDSLGIIIRTNTWEKDVSKDRFIDISQPDANGVVDYYLVQGDETIYTDDSAVDTSNKIMAAYFSDTSTITITGTEAMTQSNILIKKDGVSIPFNNFESNGKTVSVDINQDDFDLGSAYTVTVNFSDITRDAYVTFDGIYDSTAFADEFTYNGDDLGLTYSPDSTTFKLWAPVSNSVQLVLYDTGTPAILGGSDTPVDSLDLIKGDYGVWSTTISQNLDGYYYTYKVTNGTTTNEVIDPYANSTGVNGIRGYIYNPDTTKPSDFDPTDKPYFSDSITDAIIYELHVRDLTTSDTWNGPDEYRGTFMGLAQTGTTYDGIPTGLDHIVDLGVTHVHLLPSFDFGVVDETKLNDPTYNAFNWGYMPLNFNSPEGSYSTDPYNGATRVVEFKTAIQAMHDNGLRVVMDVVYNHTGLSADSNFNLIVPGYYYRMNDNGTFSNGSGTGNETASERSMVRKFMVDSVMHWATEYGIDGFRFDLMGLHDIDTMNTISETLHEYDPSIIVYGEPWTGGTSPLPDSEKAIKINASALDNIAVFNDDTRDGIKGSVWTDNQGGYIQGDVSFLNAVKLGVAGGAPIDGYTSDSWASGPYNVVNYVSAHDNLTLYDKLKATMNRTDSTIAMFQKQANAIVLTSQGASFIHAGAEFMRTKDGNDNSYESPDSVNQLDWSRLKEFEDVSNYYKGLIEIRRNHPAFTLKSNEDIESALSFLDTDNANILAYRLQYQYDSWGDIVVVHNASNADSIFRLPEGEDWNIVANESQAGLDVLSTDSAFIMPPHSTYIAYANPQDITEPTFRLATNGQQYEPGEVVYFPFSSGSATLNGEVYTSNTPITEDGIYHLVYTNDYYTKDISFDIGEYQSEVGMNFTWLYVSIGAIVIGVAGVGAYTVIKMKKH